VIHFLIDYDKGPTPWPEPHSLLLVPGEPPRRIPMNDPYNTVSTPPATDVVEWDDSTVEVVVLETPPEDVTAELPFPGEYP
jgi:hypothetical protein